MTDLRLSVLEPSSSWSLPNWGLIVAVHHFPLPFLLTKYFGDPDLQVDGLWHIAYLSVGDLKAGPESQFTAATLPVKAGLTSLGHP